jgi:hypothetical protein
MTGARYFANLAAAEQTKIDALIEAKALARQLAEHDSPIAEGVARVWHLLDEVIPETDLLEIVEANVVDEDVNPPDR